MKLRPGNPGTVGMSAQRVRHIVDLAAGWVAEGITPALVVLVARKGVIVLHEAFGRLGPEQDSPPLELDTLFPLMSLTKPITATAIMLLVEDGLLGLNRPVRWYLPEFSGEGKDAVMVHHLLTHTSGLRREEVEAHAEGKGGSVQVPPPDETQHPLVHRYLFPRYDAPLWKPPGVEMSYCSYGYKLLGEIVRRVSGISLAGYCREQIFGPLGMTDTHYIVPDSVSHRVVRRAADDPVAAGLEAHRVAETPWAMGGAYSTAMDLAVFGQMFLNGGAYGDARILSPASVKEMTRNQIQGISAQRKDEFFPEASWGLGWDAVGCKRSSYYGTLRSTRTFLHGGSGGVYLWVDPVYEIVGAYFSVQATEQWYADLFVNAVTAAIVRL
jgi:CubicO group peptidase (beta-lactamase class C family)